MIKTYARKIITLLLGIAIIAPVTNVAGASNVIIQEIQGQYRHGGFNDGLMLVRSTDLTGWRYGFINENLEVAIDMQYIFATPFYNGVAVVAMDERNAKIINTAGELVNYLHITTLVDTNPFLSVQELPVITNDLIITAFSMDDSPVESDDWYDWFMNEPHVIVHGVQIFDLQGNSLYRYYISEDIFYGRLTVSNLLTTGAIDLWYIPVGYSQLTPAEWAFETLFGNAEHIPVQRRLYIQDLLPTHNFTLAQIPPQQVSGNEVIRSIPNRHVVTVEPEGYWEMLYELIPDDEVWRNIIHRDRTHLLQALVDDYGNFLIEPQTYALYPIAQDLILFTEWESFRWTGAHRHGLMDASANIIIEPTFLSFTPMHNGVMWIQDGTELSNGSRWYAINDRGQRLSNGSIQASAIVPVPNSPYFAMTQADIRRINPSTFSLIKLEPNATGTYIHYKSQQQRNLERITLKVNDVTLDMPVHNVDGIFYMNAIHLAWTMGFDTDRARSTSPNGFVIIHAGNQMHLVNQHNEATFRSSGMPRTGELRTVIEDPAIVNGKDITIPPVFRYHLYGGGGTMMFPVEVVIEAFDGILDFDETTQTLRITMPWDVDIIEPRY